MPPLLVGPRCLLVAALVVSNHLADMLGLGRSPPAAKQDRASGVQRPAHLFPCHPRIFPPSAAPYGLTRSPLRSTPGSGAASAPRSFAPRSASAPPLSSPAGSRARSSRGETLPAVPLAAAPPAHCSRSTS